jgi:cell wall-associated NlpC family hydrolase
MIVRSAVAPVLREPNLRSEQVTQLVLGETARALETSSDWYRVRTDLDSYEGWIHRGYVWPVDAAGDRRWRAVATAWSDGAVARVNGSIVKLPLRARVGIHGRDVTLPEDTTGSLVAGRVLPSMEARRRALTLPPERWATEAFAGAPYEWGGVTPWGVDCSGLVQTTFLARGKVLPRDARDQAQAGVEVPADRVQPGDLLFFSERADTVTHVAFAGPGDTLVHSTLSCGGFVVESWGPGTRAAFLHDQLVTIRRITE